MTYRFFVFFITIGISLGLQACGPSQSTQQSDTVDVPPKEAASDIRPTWFIESSRTTSDTKFVYGYGMAVSYDSAQSMNQAIQLARGDLKQSAGDSLEVLRKSLVKQDADQNKHLAEPRFLIDLRNATSEISSRSQIGRTEIKRKKRKWISFVRVQASWSTIHDQLSDELSAYPAFIELL